MAKFNFNIGNTIKTILAIIAVIKVVAEIAEFASERLQGVKLPSNHKPTEDETPA